jgi:GTP-binding protein YchF
LNKSFFSRKFTAIIHQNKIGKIMSGLSCAIVGLPNVGKSTLFNALTRNRVAASNYPFCTIDPNVGIVNVPDERLAILSKISGSRQIVPATTTFVDVAGLVKGASAGEGLGNQFLSHIRETDAIVQMVRCFEDDNVIHVSGDVDPIRDIEVINLELILADLQMIDNILKKVEKQAKGKKEMAIVISTLEKVKQHLDKGLPVRSLEFTKEEQEVMRSYPFLSNKKTIYVANVADSDLPSMENTLVAKVRAYAEAQGSDVIPICARLEEELAQLEPAEAQELLIGLGLKESGLDRLIKASYHTLDLISYLTTGEIETRAWTIPRGSTAVEAAGKIHTDIQKGFIRAEVIAYADFVTGNGRVGAKEAGKMRAEGRDYVVKDGDVVLFLHN